MNKVQFVHCVCVLCVHSVFMHLILLLYEHVMQRMKLKSNSGTRSTQIKTNFN